MDVGDTVRPDDEGTRPVGDGGVRGPWSADRAPDTRSADGAPGPSTAAGTPDLAPH